MNAIHISSFTSSLSDLHPQTVPLPPSPGPKQVLVDVHHVALNHVDVLYARGKHQNNTALIRPPFTLGLEFAGVVREVGPRESKPSTASAHDHGDGNEDEDGNEDKDGGGNGNAFKPGTPVFGSHIGAFAEVILVPARSLYRLPPSSSSPPSPSPSSSSSISLRESTALASGAPVAYGAVVRRAAVQSGDWVLVHGAAGGIGVYACQIVKALGARVIAGVRRAADVQHKLDPRRMRCELDGVVVTGEDEHGQQQGEGEGWEKQVQRLTGGRGVDVVIDNVGLVGRSLRCLRSRDSHGGKIVLVGFAGRQGVMEQVAMNRVLLRQAVIIGYVSFSLLYIFFFFSSSRLVFIRRCFF